MRALLAASLALALAACRPRADTPTPYVDRDGRVTPLGEACEALRSQGCEEGLPLRNGLTCYEHLSRLSGKVRIPTKCLVGAKSPDDVRACGTPAELRFECAPTPSR